VNDQPIPGGVAAAKPHPALLAICGSARPGSYNARLLGLAAEAALALDTDVSALDLRDLDLPIYCPSIGGGAMPQGVLVIRQILSAHDGLLIATPEYNGSLPPLLTNALDWASRPTFGAKGLAPFRQKVAALLSVCDAPGGGANGLAHLRGILTRLEVYVLPETVTMPSDAFGAFALRDPEILPRVGHQLRQLVAALHARGQPS